MLSPTTQTTQTKLSPAQSLFKSLTQEPALPLGPRPSATGSGPATSSPAHYSPSTIHVEKPSESASLKTSSTQAKIARVSPTISRVTPVTPSRPIEDIFRYFNLCRTSSPNNKFQVFDKVSTRDFETLESIVEKWSFQQTQPKLSHHPATGLLIIEMPTPAHKFAITDFSMAVWSALDTLPINRHRLRIALEPNLTLRSTLTGFVATPGLALVCMSTGQRCSKNVFAMVECAYSQDRNSLMEKIRDEVEGWPEITLVVAIIVTEDHDYKSPLEDSPTWNYFAQHESILSPQDFLSLHPSIDGSMVEHSPLNTADPAGPRYSTVLGESDSDSDDELEPLVLNPITIAGHTWCHIHDVQYLVWVKEDGVLDLNGDSTNGLLYPTIEMEGVEQAINSGLSAAKDEIVNIAAESMKSRSALRKLQLAQLSRANFDWATTQSTIRIAAEQTALSRYETWFLKTSMVPNVRSGTIDHITLWRARAVPLSHP
ncbi:hypothetical protein JVT61DRAFT_5441 [Boletus reticuloceps]|uniref:Uncharacterized protein n=1 Tax=Boletus reticuloceps TaxID=495285 RepID=A0A8I2YZJ0_9AGAM|nr:hypothetical protein JVT61DRAFT_5441 [Boletus reticuloceps]